MVGHRRAATRIFLFVLKFPPACVRPAGGRSGRDRPPTTWPPSLRVPCTRPTVVVFKSRFGYDPDSYNPCARFPRGARQVRGSSCPSSERISSRTRPPNNSTRFVATSDAVCLTPIRRTARKQKCTNTRLRIFRTSSPSHRQSIGICLSLHCKHVIIINRTETDLCRNQYYS